MDTVAFAGCRGWIHKAGGGRGAILCGAWGFEELCSRRSLAYLGDRLAEKGVTALRFDYRGCGDSAEPAETAGLLETWEADIVRAAQYLREEHGLTEVVLVGLRLGAVVAALAAPRIGATRLALLAPPVSGRAMLRECAAFAMLSHGAYAHEQSAGWDGVDAAGFKLPQEDLLTLRAVDLRRIEVNPAPKTLIFAPARSAVLDSFSQRVVELGGQVEQRDFGLYAGMMCDPTASQTPVETLQQAAEWLAEDAPEVRLRAASVQQTSVLSSETWIEEPARLDGNLFGVLTRPRPSLHHEGRLPRRAVIFLNAGGIRQVGWAGMHVAMARRLAKADVASLRFDATGVGDSPPYDTVAPLFAHERRTDVAAAIDWLCERGVEDVALVGACSGAHHAFHLACADERVRAVALVNMVCILWGPSYAIQLSAWRATKTAQMQARGFAVSGEAHNEVAALAAFALPLARKFARRSFGALKTLSVLASGLSGKKIVERKFAELARRGVQVRLVYSADDPGLEELARYMGRGGAQALRHANVQKVVIPDADHMLTQAHAQDALADTVLALVQSNAIKDSASEPIRDVLTSAAPASAAQ